MKKIIGITLSMLILISPLGASSVFADDINNSNNVKEVKVLNENGRASGVASLERIRNGIAWRVTSRMGNILTFGGTVDIYNTKTGKFVTSKAIFRTGRGSNTMSGTLTFPKLKKGTYRAEFDGNGTATRGLFFVSGNVVNHFTVY